MDKIYRYFESLELRPDASLEEAKKAYLDLVKVWHQDRFAGNHHLQKKPMKNFVRLTKLMGRLLFIFHIKSK
jgi:curved DNA-binding protein CbpA